jgi:hypothetical protein
MPKQGKQEDNSTSAAWFKRDPRKQDRPAKNFFHRPLTVKLDYLVKLKLACGS